MAAKTDCRPECGDVRVSGAIARIELEGGAGDVSSGGARTRGIRPPEPLGRRAKTCLGEAEAFARLRCWLRHRPLFSELVVGILAPIRNLRFNQGVLAMLAPWNVEAVGAPQRLSPFMVPPLQLGSFTFTSMSDAI